MSLLHQLCRYLRQIDAPAMRTLRGVSLLSAVFCLLTTADVHAEEPPTDNNLIRVILSEKTLTNINVNDATAAFRVWMHEFGKNLDVAVSKDPMVLSSKEAISSELDKYPNHLVTLSLPEYLNFDSDRFTQNIILGKGQNYSESGNRYLLLVLESGSIEKLEDLKDKTLVQYDHLQTMMAKDWLDYQLVDAGQTGSADFLGRYTQDTDLSKAVLGVFFGKIDACIVTNSSFDLLCELNPQLRLKMRILAESPIIINGAMFIQNGGDPLFELKVIHSLEQLGTDTYGKQILTIFRADAVYRANLSKLHESLDLYRTWTAIKEAGE